MFVEIVTTITTKVDLDTFVPEHSVEIECRDEGLPTDLIYGAVIGGCKSTVTTVYKKAPWLDPDAKNPPITDDEEA